MKKTTKKTTKPAYVIDIVDAENSKDVITATGLAKIDAGYPITKQEFDAIILAIQDTVVANLFANADVLIKLEDGRIIPGMVKPNTPTKSEDTAAEPKKKTLAQKVKSWFKK